MWFMFMGCVQGTANEISNDAVVPNIEETLESHGVSERVSTAATKAFEKASKDTQTSIYTVIDMTEHSKEKRLWTIDVVKNELLFHEHVAHGRMSDSNHDGLLDSVSNVPNSKQTSVGLYKTAEVYTGKHGRSLKLDGLEKGFNDNARDRAIVMHGADYATDSFIQKHGKTGRSFGCPAVSDDVSNEVIDTIKDGTLLFIYADDELWLQTSAYLK